MRYGSRRVAAAAGGIDPGGDLDLIVLVDHSPAGVESIHLYLGGLPVDLHVRTWRDVERAAHGDPLTDVDYAIVGGEILYDRDGDLPAGLRALAARLTAPLPSLSEHDIAFLRFGQRHSLDKVRGRLASEPILCRVLLESNIYWLLQHYFRLRRRRFPSEKGALRELAQQEPALWSELVRFYAATDLHQRLTLAEVLNERVLGPIGGLWKRDEILTFGAAGPTDAATTPAGGTGGLQEVGQHYLQELLGAVGQPPPGRSEHGRAYDGDREARDQR